MSHFYLFATAGSIVRAEAVPVFIDINPHTYNIEPDKLEEFINVGCKINRETGELIHRSSGKIVKAIIPVHLYGQMCRMDEIMRISVNIILGWWKIAPNLSEQNIGVEGQVLMEIWVLFHSILPKTFPLTVMEG